MSTKSTSNPILNPAAVAANREGKITDGQRQAFLSVKDRILEIGIVVMVIGVIVGFVAAELSRSSGQLELYCGLGIALFAGLCFLAVGFYRASGASVRHKIETAEIEQREGQVIWRGDNYVARAQRRRLKPVYEDMTLPPGKYHFFCVKGTTWLLSAEPVIAERSFAYEELLITLARLNKLRLGALDLNRQGRMSVAQAFSLTGDIIFNLIGVLIAVIGAAVCLLVLRSPEPLPVWMMILASMILAIIALISLRGALVVVADMLRRDVAVVEGTGYRHTDSSGDSTAYFYRIGMMSFGVTEKALNALVDGQQYRVYYAPRTRRLLNIEPFKKPVNSTT